MLTKGLMALASLTGGEPDAIQNLRAARAAIRSADIHWSIANAKGEVRRYRFQRSPGGDRAFTRDSTPAELESAWYSTGPRQVVSWYLIENDGTVWQRIEDSSVVRRFRDNPSIRMTMTQTAIDPTELGVDTMSLRAADEKSLWSSVVSFSGETRMDDGRVQVIGTMDDGNRHRWTINPDRGWNAERLELMDARDNVMQTTEIELQRLGEVWLPLRAVITTPAYPSSATTMTIESDSRINDSALPVDLTPAAIGIDAGFLVSDATKGVQAAWTDVWDGDQLVAAEQWRSGIAEGSYKPGPSFLANKAAQARRLEARKSHVAADKVGFLPDCWELYVNSFCDAYALENAQRREAERILDGCRKKAVSTLEKSPSLRPLYKQLRASRSADENWFAKAHSFVANSMDELKPVKEIFVDDLQARLFKLPTRQQIEKSSDPEKLSAKRTRP